MNPNLAHFKKVKEDDHVAILKHPSGHEIRIAKKALSPKLKAQLQSLPMHLDQGGEIPYQELEAQQALRDSPDAPYTMNMANQPSILSQNDQPSQVQQPQASANASDQSLAPAQPTPDNLNYPVGSAQPSATGAPPQASASMPFANEKDYLNDVSGVKSGIQAEAKAQGQQGKAESEAAMGQQDALQNVQQKYSTSRTALDSQVDALRDDIAKTKIEPNHYFENLSVPGKISTAIGLILGGIGGGLTGKGNPVQQWLESQMNRDIEAQKANLGKKENLLSANLKQYGNLQDATNMTRIMQADIYSTQLKQAAAKAVDPAAKARALQAASEFDLKIALPLKNQFALRQAVLGSGAQQPTQVVDGKPVQQPNDQDRLISYLRMTNPEMAKEMEGRHVPGVGMASVPVNDKVREELSARQSLQDQVRNLRQWASQHSGEIGALSPSDVNYGQALSNSVQDAYRRANGQGVFREAEANFVRGIVDTDPTKFFNQYRTDPKYKALEDSNQLALNGLKKSYGLPIQPQANLNTRVPGGYKRANSH